MIPCKGINYLRIISNLIDFSCFVIMRINRTNYSFLCLTISIIGTKPNWKLMYACRTCKDRTYGIEPCPNKDIDCFYGSLNFFISLYIALLRNVLQLWQTCNVIPLPYGGKVPRRFIKWHSGIPIVGILPPDFCRFRGTVISNRAIYIRR